MKKTFSAPQLGLIFIDFLGKIHYFYGYKTLKKDGGFKWRR